MIYDGQQFKNIAATTAAFPLVGGYYVLDVHATFGGGTVKLQRQAGDGSTYLDVPNSSLTADGTTTGLYCPPGQYKINIATATAVYAQLGRVPVG